MTWSQFLSSMRSGIQARAASVQRGTGRRAPQQQKMSKTTPTQSAVATAGFETKKTRYWENMVLDVSPSLSVTHLVFHLPPFSLTCLFLSCFAKEYGEPTILMLVPPL